MILIIDDDSAIRSSLSFLLKRAGMEVLAVSTPKEAIAAIQHEEPELMLMDMNYSLTTSGDEGICLLKQVKLFCPDVPVILMTAWGSIQLAVEGMRAGAFDFITKPWNNIVLLNRVKTALDLREHEANKGRDTELEVKDDNHLRDIRFAAIIGESRALKAILETVKRVAKTNASILITGESGTGKELIAEAIHKFSTRASAPYVKVNLGGISQNLFESEMFGHKKGAFTDAFADRDGRFLLADKGTIFLDEIGDLDPSCQVKLLRVLQDQMFEVLGDSSPKKVDIRVVSATNRDLPKLVAEQGFREDLFYRINLIPIHLPPLRERQEDIPLLVYHFAKSVAQTHGLDMPIISEDAILYLQKLPFVGNIRELKNLVERTIIISGKNILEKSDFEASQINMLPSQEEMYGNTLEEREKRRIAEVLIVNDNNISKTARELGISRASLYRRLDKYNIPYNH